MDPAKKREFLINNYDLVCSILEEKPAETMASEQEYWGLILKKNVHLFVEAQLAPKFRDLMSFLNVSNKEGAKVDVGKLSDLPQSLQLIMHCS